MNGRSGMRVLDGQRLIVVICVLGLVVRLLALVLYDPGDVFSDDDRFWEEIVNVVEHNSFHAGGIYAHDMPLTAILLGLFVKMTGTGATGAKVLLAIISSLTIFFIARIAYTFHPSRLTLWISGLGAALYPFFIFYSLLICSETIYLFLLTVFFFIALKKSTSACILSGFVAGLCHLTRPTLLPFLPVAWIWQRLSGRIQWRYVLISAALFVVTILPWVVRNHIVFGEYVIGTIGSGHVLLEGNNPYNETGGIGGDDLRYLEGLPPGISELEADRWQRDKAIENIMNDPGRFLRIAVKKFFRFWYLWPNAPEYDRPIFRWASLLSFGPVLLFSLLSIPIFRKDRGRLILVWLFVCYYTILHMITIGSLRYRLPLEPLLLALASASLSWLLTARRRSGGFRAEKAEIAL
jgi:hypothetical protein